MQSTYGTPGPVELGHPDFFADLDHPNGIDHVSLSTIFPPEPDATLLDIPDIIQAEERLKKAKADLEAIETRYADMDCPAVMESKSSMELIGAVAGWTSIFMPVLPQNKYTVAFGIILNTIGKIATDMSNEAGRSDAVSRCQKCLNDISNAQNKVEAAQERYETEVKEVFGVYTQRVRKKKATETSIRDWKNYVYKLEVYRHQLDPSKPKPSPPVYAFRATPVPSERNMRFGAGLLKNAVASGI